jgi:D-aminoacyl-tRNA deacylase
MKRSFRHLWHHGSGGEYQVTVEATHHGPLTNVPCFFAEIGSTSERWVDAVAGDAVSRAVVESLFDADSCQQVAVGFGGPHYSDRFARLLLETDHAVSHIVPKHHISSLSGEMIETLFSRSRPPADIAILDWKGIRGSERRELIEHLREQGRDYLKLSECLQRDATGDP